MQKTEPIFKLAKSHQVHNFITSLNEPAKNPSDLTLKKVSFPHKIKSYSQNIARYSQLSNKRVGWNFSSNLTNEKAKFGTSSWKQHV